MGGISERLWSKLLDYIEERRVVPVVGSELLAHAYGNPPVPLYRQVADRVAANLRIPLEGLAPDYSLNEVVSRFSRAPAEEQVTKRDMYREVRAVLKGIELEPSQALSDLASITHFDLFVSLTFDSLLATAINRQRFGGEPCTEVVAYSHKETQDLRTDRKALVWPVVFHLLGRASALPDYVICDEDMLEFVSALQDRTRQPARLLRELEGNHLLIIGSGFPDWLTRLFIRIAKSKALSEKSDMEVLVGQRVDSDNALVSFLNAFSRDTHLIPASPEEFVSELARRWRERNPEKKETAAPAARGAAVDAGFMKPGAIFVSYARQNLEAARRLVNDVEAAGLEVWLDQGELQAGDTWDPKIRINIDSCSLFIPLISRETEARREGYFRKEWNLAAERALSFADDAKFILPVLIDGTAEATASVPERFRGKQWTVLPEGRTTAEFVERLRQLTRDYHRRQRV